MRKCLVFTILILFATKGITADFNCVFKPGKWNKSDWLLIKSSRWDYFGDWIQKKDHIQNCVPAGVSAAELQGKRASETYTCMLWKKSLNSDKTITVHSRMSFDNHMAPLIVFSGIYGKDKKHRPELREHWEVVLYDKGLNIWHHEYKEGKPCWYLAASLKADFQPKVIYNLQVNMRKINDKMRMEVSCGDEKLTYTELHFPKQFQTGITGCEGINCFYDFGVKY